MKPPRLLRLVLVFSASLAVGVGFLLLVGGVGGGPEGPGFRIETVDRPEVKPIPLPEGFDFPENLPDFLALEAPRVVHYDDVLLPDATGRKQVCHCLTWQLECARIDDQGRGRDVLFHLFPTPLTVEDAELDSSNRRTPSVELRAGSVRVRGVPIPGSTGKSQVVLSLSDTVRLHSRGPTGAITRLDADDLQAFIVEGLLSSAGNVHISGADLDIRGVGLEGDLGLGAFSVLRDVRAVLPTAALLGEQAGAAPGTTRVRSAGRLHVERRDPTEDGGLIPTRVTVSEQVRVVQIGADGAEGDSLACRELVLELLVRSEALEEPGEQAVTVVSLDAVGDVVLRSGPGSTVRADHLTITPLPDGEEIVLDGEVRVHHLGPMSLPGAPAGPEGDVRTLDIHARDRAVIRRTASTGAANARFEGDARLRHATEAGGLILEVNSRILTFTSEPEGAKELTATGDARFATPSATGTAARIHWSQREEGKSEIRLEEGPRVELAGGAGFDLLAAPPPPSATPGEAAPRLVISCEGELVLNQAGETSDLTADRGAEVSRFLGETEVVRVAADRMEARLVGETLESLAALGAVRARGRVDPTKGGEWTATADSLHFPGEDGSGLLQGKPAELTVTDLQDRTNEIRADRFVFREDGGAVVAAGDVRASVQLESGSGRVHPFRLDCDRLDVSLAPTNPETSGDEESGDADLTGRIRSLLATGNVALSARDQTARGDRLTYGKGEERGEVSLTGNPAQITREQILHGKHYEDLFTSREFQVRIEDGRIASFASPVGGGFLMHREFEALWPGVMGAGAGDTNGKDLVERLTGRCKGPLSYQVLVRGRMTGDAWVEQELGRVGSFRSVAKFSADVIEADVSLSADDMPILTRASGRGNVHGRGEGWEAWCDEFVVDLKSHLTTVRGSPARVNAGTGEILVDWGIYDYEKDQWKEFSGVRNR